MNINKLLDNRLINLFLGILLIATCTEILLNLERFSEFYFFNQEWISTLFKHILIASFYILLLANLAGGSVVKGRKYVSGFRDVYNKGGYYQRREELYSEMPLTKEEEETKFFVERVLNTFHIGLYGYYLTISADVPFFAGGFPSFEGVILYLIVPYILSFVSLFILLVGFLKPFLFWCFKLGIIVRKILIGLLVLLVLYIAIISLIYFIKYKDYQTYVDFGKFIYRFILEVLRK
jgi:hypothetical protein